MQNPDIILNEENFEIFPLGLAILNANPGDRILIGYLEDDGILSPIILKSEEGNLLSTKNKVIYKGKERNTLASYGTRFEMVLKGNNIFLKGDKPEYKVYTSMKKAQEYVLDKATVLDDTYSLKNYKQYEF